MSNKINFSNASHRRLARQLVDMSESKRKEALRALSTDDRCKIVEEMVNIRLQRLKTSTGTLRTTPKVSPK